MAARILKFESKIDRFIRGVLVSCLIKTLRDNLERRQERSMKMTRVKLPAVDGKVDRELGFSFQHINETGFVVNEPTKQWNRITKCRLFDFKATNGVGQQQVVDCIATGMSRSSVKDNFSKEQGRKRSLKRAIQVAGLPYSERAAIWKTYLNRREIELERLKAKEAQAVGDEVV